MGGEIPGLRYILSSEPTHLVVGRRRSGGVAQSMDRRDTPLSWEVSRGARGRRGGGVAESIFVWLQHGAGVV